MKKLILSILIAATAALSAQAKSLVVYFSWGEAHKAEVDATTSASVVLDGGAKYGLTEQLAKQIAKSAGADIWRIEPLDAYPKEYSKAGEVVKDELEKGRIRAVKGSPDFAKYDVIFVGTPVWWHTAPTMVTNFLQEHKAELSGKTVIPFCSYWATYSKETLAALTEATPTAAHKEGFAATRVQVREVEAWLKKIGEAK